MHTTCATPKKKKTARPPRVARPGLSYPGLSWEALIKGISVVLARSWLIAIAEGHLLGNKRGHNVAPSNIGKFKGFCLQVGACNLDDVIACKQIIKMPREGNFGSVVVTEEIANILYNVGLGL